VFTSKTNNSLCLVRAHNVIFARRVPFLLAFQNTVRYMLEQHILLGVCYVLVESHM
jgi:hypothetical protein